MTTAGVHRTAVLSPVATGITLAVLALNLRPAITSMGALLVRIEAAADLSSGLVAILVALPTWTFAIGGWIAWRLRARAGIRAVITSALAVLTVSLVARTLPGNVAILAGTTAACLAIAVLGTLLPVIVHAAAPSSAACYTACLGAGSALGALLTPTGLTWQIGLGCWAILAAVALVIWIGSSHHLAAPARAARVSPRHLIPRGTVATLTVHFGLLSAVTFVLMGRLPTILHAAGLTPGEATNHFAAVMVLGVPVSLAVPYLTRRIPHTLLAVMFAGSSITGVTGLLISPTSVTWLWTGLLGIGLGALALALVDLGRRTGGDPDTTAALSSVVQGLGYTLAGAATLGIGLLEGVTGTWTWPLFSLIVALVGQALTGTTIGDVRATTSTEASPVTVINLYWTLRSADDRPAGQLVEAARNTDFNTLDVVRGWVEQLTAQGVLRAGTDITVHHDTASIRQRHEPDLTLTSGDWIVHAPDRLLVVDDAAFRATYSATPPKSS